MFPLLLNAENYEDKFYKNRHHHPSAVAIHTDFGYSSYRIEFDSSEMQSAIDYDILESVLGVSYSYDGWMWGLYGKFIVDELRSNMTIQKSDERLGNHAHISRHEFGFYANHTLSQSKSRSLSLNTVYRYALLDVEDSYLSYYRYASQFRYQTQGVALSLVYHQNLTNRSRFFLNTGITYNQAEITISQRNEGILQDSYVDDEGSTMGGRLSLGHSYRLSSSLFFNIRTNWWHSIFSKLSVESRVGDRLPKGRLREDTRSLYGGIIWLF